MGYIAKQLWKREISCGVEQGGWKECESTRARRGCELRASEARGTIKGVGSQPLKAGDHLPVHITPFWYVAIKFHYTSAHKLIIQGRGGACMLL